MFFSGPLFIIGMPRSGTKLLRSLLNEHTQISILEIETEFLPFWKKKWEEFGNLSNQDNFNKFYEQVIKSSYFFYKRNEGKLYCKGKWYADCEGYSVEAVFEALVRHDTSTFCNRNKIWGDKSPSYIHHIPLLKGLYPKAKFIHIIRDVRDYSLSISNAWNKDPLRAAQRWATDVSKARSQGLKIRNDYLEVRYEDLLSSPENALIKVCNFLGVKFQSSMLSPPANTENLGEAKGSSSIKKDNKNKYKINMDSDLKERIEAIAKDELIALNYSISYEGRVKKINRICMIYYQLKDGIHLFLFNVKVYGLVKGGVFQWRYFIRSGNRDH